MKGLTVRLRVIASFAIIIAIMVGMATTFYLRTIDNEARANLAKNGDLGGVVVAVRIRMAMTDHLQTIAEYLIGTQAQGEHATVSPKTLRDRLAGIDAEIDRAMAAYPPTITFDSDRELFGHLQIEHDRLTNQTGQLLDLLDGGRLVPAAELFNGQIMPEWAKAQSLVSSMIKVNEDELDTSMDGIIAATAANRMTAVLALGLAAIIATLCGMLLYRNIIRPIDATLAAMRVLGRGDLSNRLNLGRHDEFGAIEKGFNSMVGSLRDLVVQAQRSAVQLTTSITEIAASSKQQQATVTESAATTAEIGATTREIAATSRDLVRTMGEVSSYTEQTAMLAGSGQMGVSRMSTVMQQLTAAAELVSVKLALLNEKASGINQVVTTIVKVADQTNLLSLNAAIEAEKAGDYGRGFSVVATEVRRLADQTAVATYDIEQMVREIQSAVSAGVMGMDKLSEEVRRGNVEMTQVGEQLSQIIHQIQALAPRVLLVNEGMQAQSVGAGQIHEALGQLGEASVQAVDSLQQAGSAIDNLNEVADDLRAGVSRFKV